jgi:hypothetical protein
LVLADADASPPHGPRAVDALLVAFGFSTAVFFVSARLHDGRSQARARPAGS